MRKHFLLLMLMALLPMAGFALTLDVSQFECQNIPYGTATLPNVSLVTGSTYTTADYTVEADKFYAENDGTMVEVTTSLATTPKGKYFRKVLGAGAYDTQTVYVDFWIKGIDVTIDFDNLNRDFGAADVTITYTLSAADKDKLGLSVSRVAGTAAGEYEYTFDWTNKNYTLTRATSDAAVYTINKKDISSEATITAWQGNVVYTGNEIIPVYTVLDKVGGTTLTAGTPEVLYADVTEYNTAKGTSLMLVHLLH